MRRRVKRRYKLNTRFFMLLTVVALLSAVGVILALINTTYGVLTDGSVTLSITVPMVIIRDEECFSSEQFDRVVFSAAEGAQVSIGDEVASVFKWGYTDESTHYLMAVQKEILNEQMRLMQGIEKPELTAIGNN